jgi:nucleoside-diphosphate-sugar epimerase
VRIALTGASGFIGSALVRRLAAAGHRVTALLRPSSRRDHITAHIDRIVEGDHAQGSCWPALLDGADCVIHASVSRDAWNEDTARALDYHLQSNLLASIKLIRASAPRQFIFISSMAVHLDLNHYRVHQDRAFELPGSYYAAYKASIEAHLRAEHADGRPIAILRPCRTYGIDPDLKRSEGYDLLQALHRGEPIRRPGWGRWVHIDDVAAATTAAVGNSQALGQTYDLVDCYARHSEWARIAADVLRVNATIDESGPAEPGTSLNAAAARVLGITFNRGLDGIRRHLTELAALTAP